MAQSPINVIAGITPAFAYESITISNTAKTLTSDTYTDSEGNRAVKAIIRVENAQLRYRYDGTNPTASEGMLLNPMDTLILNCSSDIINFRAIRKGNTDSKIFVTYSV